jgi:hypothetical protein
MIPRPMDESSKKFMMYLKTGNLFMALDSMFPIQLTPRYKRQFGLLGDLFL